MKHLLSTLLCAAILALGNCATHAQQAGVWQVFGVAGLTNPTVIPAFSTNTLWWYASNGVPAPTLTNTWSSPGGILSLNTNLLEWGVDEFDYTGFTYSFNTTAPGTANGLLVYGSDDNGGTFNTNAPLLQIFTTNATAANYVTNGYIDTHGVTHLAFVIQNWSSRNVTNAYFALSFKANKIEMRQATH